jgi:predicted transcriptional regulator
MAGMNHRWDDAEPTVIPLAASAKLFIYGVSFFILNKDVNMSLDLTELTVKIVSAYVSNNNLPVSEIPTVIRSVRDALTTANQPPAEPVEELKPAVPIKKSVTADYIVCLEDGKRLKMLKRHLMSSYNMTPDQYRAKWGLPTDYPMVAPNYAKSRSELALKLGLGRKAG